MASNETIYSSGYYKNIIFETIILAMHPNPFLKGNIFKIS
jgi:hypothetical protein